MHCYGVGSGTGGGVRNTLRNRHYKQSLQADRLWKQNCSCCVSGHGCECVLGCACARASVEEEEDYNVPISQTIPSEQLQQKMPAASVKTP